MTLRKNKHNGFSLLELLLVVSVGILLILAGLAIYRNVTNQRLTNDAVRLLNVLKQETQKLYQGEPAYGAAGTNLNVILINSEAPPSGAITGAATIEHPWNGAINVVAQGNLFDIVFVNIPQGACINMAQTYNDSDPDFQQVTINTTAIAANAITVATANTNCVAGDNNTLIWQFD